MSKLDTFLNNIVEEVSQDYFKNNNHTLEQKKTEMLENYGYKKEYKEFYLTQLNTNNLLFVDNEEVIFLNKYIKEYENTDKESTIDEYVKNNHSDLQKELKEHMKAQYIVFIWFKQENNMDNYETFKLLEEMFNSDNEDENNNNDNYGTLFEAFGIELWLLNNEDTMDKPYKKL